MNGKPYNTLAAAKQAARDASVRDDLRPWAVHTMKEQGTYYITRLSNIGWMTYDT